MDGGEKRRRNASMTPWQSTTLVSLKRWDNGDPLEIKSIKREKLKTVKNWI